jgi:hypothetical protein
MAEIKFYANINGNSATSDATIIRHDLGSGIGFYGSTFGVSVPVDSQQTTTWVTNSDGTVSGVRLNNTAMVSEGDVATTGTVSVNSSTAINLDKLPNYLCPLNIRFTHTEPVKVQNCKLRIFDRSNIANHASGVTTYVWEARHPSSSQTVTQLSQRGNNNIGTAWYEFSDLGDAMDDMEFTASPGMSGLNTAIGEANTALGYATTEGVTHTSDIHDWYVALSSEPDSIGSKTNYGLYFSVEYL